MDSSQFTLSGELGLRRDELDSREPQPGTPERRVKPRIKHAFPTRAFGTDANGESFEIECALDNISSKGLYLRTSRQLRIGVDVNVVVRFVKSEDAGATALLICEILRDEPQPDGQHGIAMAIKNYHFLDDNVA